LVLRTRQFSSAASELLVVKTLIGLAPGIGLAGRLCHRPQARRPINGEGSPPIPILVAEVYQEGVSVMLNT